MCVALFVVDPRTVIRVNKRNLSILSRFLSSADVMLLWGGRFCCTSYVLHVFDRNSVSLVVTGSRDILGLMQSQRGTFNIQCIFSVTNASQCHLHTDYMEYWNPD